MIDVIKGQKIWVELTAKEDMLGNEQKRNIWELYSGKLVLDKFETTSIIFNEAHFNEKVKKDLTEKLLELKLLDTNLLSNIVLNSGGF